jgi:hypothetical protein
MQVGGHDDYLDADGDASRRALADSLPAEQRARFDLVVYAEATHL